MDGGEPERARAALDRALALTPDDPLLHFLSAKLHGAHAELGAALDAYLAAIDRARAWDDPRGTAVVELAVAATGDLFDDVEGFEAKVQPVLTRVFETPGRLGLAARWAAYDELADLAYRRGDAAEVERLAGALGCLRSVRVAGPFGLYPLTGFDRSWPARSDGPLAASYDLGPGRGVEATREAPIDACVISIGDEGPGGAGTHVAEAFVDVAEPGPHLLAVRAGSTLEVFVDGRSALRVDRRRRIIGNLTVAPLELAAGRHEIEIVLSSRVSDPHIAVVLDRDGGAPAGYEAARGAAPFDVAGEGEDGRVARIADRLLAIDQRLLHGDPVAARELARPLDTPNATYATLMLLGRAVESDPYAAEERASAETRRIYALAAARDPQAYLAAYLDASAVQGEQEQFERLRAVADRFPHVAAVQLAWANVLDGAGLEAEATEAVARARATAPHACAGLAAEYRRLRSRLRIAEANAQVEALVACNARSLARYALYVRQRRWDDAEAELARVEALLSPEQRRARRLELAIAQGDVEAERALRAEIAEGDEDDPDRVLYLSDLRLAAGDVRGALALLTAAVERDPGGTAGLRYIRRALTGDDELDEFRVDGLSVIHDFEASGRTYADRGQVLVFDYMVTRIHPDGSTRHLIHQIFRVQSEESIERLGQMSPPGRVLTLRSIKPDGRILEPDQIDGLDSIPMTDLAIGDYVEYEVVREDAPALGGGFASGAWVFQSTNQPFEQSTMVVVAPEDMRLVIDARGPVPPVEERREHGLRVLTWTARQMPQLVAEPASAREPMFLPWLRFGVHADWSTHLESIRDGLVDIDPYDPAAARLVQTILGDRAEAPIEERARILRAWVLENIEAGAFSHDPAPALVAARRGSRTRVLRYLLELAGLDAHFALVRAFGAMPPHEELYDPSTYSSSLVYVRRPSASPLFLWAESEGAPFDYIPPGLRGQRGVLLVEGLPEVEVGDLGPAYDRRELVVDVHPSADGSSATVEVVETLYGANAIELREQLERIPPAELERAFGEGYVTRVIPGGVLTALRFENVDDPEAPLVARYAAETRALGRRVGDRLFLPLLFPQSLTRGYTPLPTRTTTEQLGGLHVDVTMRIHAAAGAPATPRPAHAEGPFGARYDQRARLDGEVFVVEREVRIPRVLVPVERYEELVGFCRAATEAEGNEIDLPAR
jgi:hypothetical protein